MVTISRAQLFLEPANAFNTEPKVLLGVQSSLYMPSNKSEVVPKPKAGLKKGDGISDAYFKADRDIGTKNLTDHYKTLM